MQPFHADIKKAFALEWGQVGEIARAIGAAEARFPTAPLDFIPRDSAKRSAALNAWLNGHMKEELILLLAASLRSEITSLAWDPDEARLYGATANSIGVSLRMAFDVGVGYSEALAELVRTGAVNFYGSVSVSRVRYEGEKSEDLQRRRQASVMRWMASSGLQSDDIKFLAEALRPEVTMLEWLVAGNGNRTGHHDNLGTLYVEHDIRVAPPPSS